MLSAHPEQPFPPEYMGYVPEIQQQTTEDDEQQSALWNSEPGTSSEAEVMNDQKILLPTAASDESKGSPTKTKTEEPALAEVKQEEESATVEPDPAEKTSSVQVVRCHVAPPISALKVEQGDRFSSLQADASFGRLK